MHHKAGSFQSEFISPKCRVRVRLLASLQLKEEKHKTTEQKRRKHSQTGEAEGETRPGECCGTRPATGVGRRHKVLGVQGRAATRAEAPRTTRAPEPGALKCAVAATERNNLCCNNGAVKSFHEQIFMFRCLWKHVVATSYRGLKCFYVHI